MGRGVKEENQATKSTSVARSKPRIPRRREVHDDQHRRRGWVWEPITSHARLREFGKRLQNQSLVPFIPDGTRFEQLYADGVGGEVTARNMRHIDVIEQRPRAGLSMKSWIRPTGGRRADIVVSRPTSEVRDLTKSLAESLDAGAASIAAERLFAEFNEQLLTTLEEQKIPLDRARYLMVERSPDGKTLKVWDQPLRPVDHTNFTWQFTDKASLSGSYKGSTATAWIFYPNHGALKLVAGAPSNAYKVKLKDPLPESMFSNLLDLGDTLLPLPEDVSAPTVEYFQDLADKLLVTWQESKGPARDAQQDPGKYLYDMLTRQDARRKAAEVGQVLADLAQNHPSEEVLLHLSLDCLKWGVPLDRPSLGTEDAKPKPSKSTKRRVQPAKAARKASSGSK